MTFILGVSGIITSFEESYDVQIRQGLGYFYDECKSSI